MRIDIVSIFPDYLAPLDLSLVGKARETGIVDIRVHDLRTWATDRHHTVDDTPTGGGAGMVMRPDVWGTALDDVLGTEPERTHLVIPTPSGLTFSQRTAEDFATQERLVIACGRYEGIDARVSEHYRGAGVRVSEVSIGDYVLGGGEAAALVMVEAVVRLLPGVLGNPESLVEESHGSDGLLEYPVYTKPPTWAGLDVPDVLLSGHHGHIERWRRDEALTRTAARRPDLIAALDVAALDRLDLTRLSELGWAVADGALRDGTAPNAR